MCVCVCGGGGGSRRYNHSNIYHIPTIGYSITCVTARGVGGGGGGGGGDCGYHCILLSQRACWYMRALYYNGNEHRR